MKRILAFTLVLLMMAASASAQMSAPGEYPIVDETAELSVFMGARQDVEDYTTNLLTTWYEEKTNVHINWQLTNPTELNQNYNLSLASGDYPDIYVYSYETSNAGELLTLANDGVIIPLNDLIDNHTVYIKQYLDEHPEIREEITAPDGNIYSLFTILANVEYGVLLKLWVYKPWLAAYMEATGNPKPTTTAEYEEMLIYFRDHDMNGNGDTTDEVPLSGNYQYWAQGADPMTFLMNAFTMCNVDPTAFVYGTEDNKIETTVMTDEFRQGLQYVHNLYTESLLSEETYVQDLNTFRSTMTVEKDKVVVGSAAAPSAFRLLTYTGDDAFVGWDDYECLEPLEGPDGYKGVPSAQDTRIILRGTITTACEDPVLAIRWLDWYWSDEGSLWTLYQGQEGVHWEWVDEESYAGDPQSVKSIYQFGSTQNIYYPTGWGIGYLKDMKAITAKAASETFNDTTLTTLYNRDTFMSGYIFERSTPSTVWCTDSDLITEKAELDTLFKNYIIQSMTEFVIGVKDINNDDDWNAFVNELQRMDFTHYLDVLTEYFYGN